MEDIVQIVNERFACAQCHTAGHWLRAARAVIRENSSIHHLRCTQCGESIVAKVSDGAQSADSAREELHDEYATLTALYASFQQDEHCGTLVPLGYLESAGHAVMLTRWCAGRDLAQYMRAGCTPDVIGRGAGVWLRRLHDCSERGMPRCTLDVAGKLAYLEATHGAALHGYRDARAACDLLARTGSGLAALQFPSVRQHGDFKPANMLSDGSRFVGLDIQWRLVGAPEFDIAPFLNQLWLAQHWSIGGRASRRHALAEAGFLAGYGYADDMRALRWAQLYFALCHVGNYRRRGYRGAIFTTLSVMPLVRRLSLALRAR